MDLTGQTLGKYKLIRRLGKGGMAQVYQANQPTIERMVAVKVLHSHLAESDDFVERFKREARGLGQLQHPHIIQVIDFDTANDLYYMVMDYIPGQTLRDYLDEKGKLSNSEALTLIAQLASAVAYAHKKGTIHRDIKPANVMFSDASCSHAILTDFGITRLVNEKSITVTGALVGTPAYMSPEAVLGEKVDGRSDIYSLGVILYEMVSGRTPYEGNTPLSLVIKQVHEPLPSILAQNPNVPLPLVHLIEKSLAKSADDRHQTIEAFLEDVRDAQVSIGDRPFGVTQVSAIRPLQSTAQTAVSDAETVIPDAKTTSRTPIEPAARWPIYAGIGFVLLLIIAGLIWRGRNEQPDLEAVVDVPTAVTDQTETTAPGLTSTPEEAAVIASTTGAAATTVPAEAVPPTETAVPTETPPPSIPLVVPDQTGTLQFVYRDAQVPNAFLLQIDRALLPPAGFHYALWLETVDGRLLNAGVLEVANGRIRVDGTRRENLVAFVNRTLISLEPDSNPADATELLGTIVYEGGLPEAYTAVLRQILSSDNDGGLLPNAIIQAQLARQHAGFAQDAINQNNLSDAKIHAEHVVNILDGETGDRFGDINLDGQAQNPGNGVGVRVYLADSHDQIAQLQQMEPLSQNRLVYAEQAVVALNNSLLTLESTLDLALSLVATDTAAEAEPFILDMIAQLDQLLSTNAADQTVTAAASHALVLAQYPLFSLDAVFPPPDPVAETIPGRVGVMQFALAGEVIGDAFELRLNQVPPPAASQEYVVWLHSSATGESRLLGAVDYHVGQVELSGTGSDNLLTGFDELVITLQPADQLGDFTVGTAVYIGSIQSELGTAILQLLADEAGPFFGIETQLRIALQHHQFAAESVAAGNLAEAKIHAEHVINILDGEDGEHFGDLNLDGQAQNPGDGVGVRGYWVRAVEGVIALGEVADVTDNQQFNADRLIATGQTSMDAIFQAIEQGQKLLASDTAAEAQPFLDEMLAALNSLLTGRDLDGNGVVDPLLGEGGLSDAVNLTLAIHEVSIFPLE